jgi:hypothetical protein
MQEKLAASRLSARLFLRIGMTAAEPQGGDIETFEQDRRRVFEKLVVDLRHFKPVSHDAATVRFDDLTLTALSDIRRYCRAVDANFDFTPQAKYRRDEISGAHFVGLGIDGEYVDVDVDGQGLNTYGGSLCSRCGSQDLTALPDPFIIGRPKRPRGLLGASNGVVVMSTALSQELMPMLGPWVKMGTISYSDSPEVPVGELVSIMPTQLIGPYARTIIAGTCEVCGRPTYAYLKQPEDVILQSMDVVKEIPPADAPIALVGMWHGRIVKREPPAVAWDVVISGELHERLARMKPKGFVAADRPFHTQAEIDRLLEA